MQVVNIALPKARRGRAWSACGLVVRSESPVMGCR